MLMIGAVMAWNSGELFADCLYHLSWQTRRPETILVVDNGRSDGSAERVRRTRSVAVARQEEILVSQQPIIALVPALLDFRAAGRRVRIYFFAEGDDRQRLQELAVAFGRQVEVLDTSASVLDFAAAIKNLDYLITSDSLALHLGIAQGILNLSFYAPTSAAEINTFGTGIKLCSISPDYCSYRKDADNSSITAKRLMAAAQVHYLNQTGNGTNG